MLGSLSVNKQIQKTDPVQLKDHTYYLVHSSFNRNNPIAKYIMFTGFVDKNNIPGSYNSIIALGDKVAEYHELHYLKVIKELIAI
jgi:hypothetical protein